MCVCVDMLGVASTNEGHGHVGAFVRIPAGNRGAFLVGFGGWRAMCDTFPLVRALQIQTMTAVGEA